LSTVQETKPKTTNHTHRENTVTKQRPTDLTWVYRWEEMGWEEMGRGEMGDEFG